MFHVRHLKNLDYLTEIRYELMQKRHFHCTSCYPPKMMHRYVSLLTLDRV